MLSLFLATLLVAQSPPPAPAMPVLATPYVATSGRTIGFRFATRAGAATVPTAATAAPVVLRNGQPVGTLTDPWVTGYHATALYALPPGVRIDPADAVTVSAPGGWAATTAGLVAGLDGVAIDNRAGRSSFGTEGLPRLLRPGWNNAHLGSQFGGTYTVSKNWRYRCDAFGGVATADATGKPLTSAAVEVSSQFVNLGPVSGIDATISFPSGLWALGWDDLDPAHPTTCRLLTYGPGMLSVVERPEFANPGVGGRGIVKVYEIRQLSAVPAAGPYNGTASLRVAVANATRRFAFDNLTIYGPGDFATAPGVPTVLDRADPYAISNTYRERLAEGAGSLRWVDSLFSYGGQSNESLPEHVYNLGDFTWGLWGGKVRLDPYFTQARPWDPAATPYVYTTLFGDPYTVVLAAPIPDATATVVAIAPDPANPAIAGLRLEADGELMRILAVADGGSVTVERGSCHTTPAPHAAGPIRCQNRWPAAGAIRSGQVFELVSARPHGVTTGQNLKAYGNWPVFAFADGSKSNGGAPITNYGPMLSVTGPNTVLGLISVPTSPPVTLAGTYALDPTCRVGATWPDGPAIPVEFAARATAAIDGADLHVNVPYAAVDELVDLIADRVRDNFPAGRKVFVEYTNEPWNFYFSCFTPLSQFSAWLEPAPAKGWEFYVRRSTQVWQRFRARFGARAGEVVGLINSQKNDAAGVALRLEYARKLGVPAGVVAIATYQNMDAGPATQAAFWRYDDEQAVDLYCHDLVTRVNGYPAVFAAMNAVIGAYNAAHGEHVSLYGYEGGVAIGGPILSGRLPAAVDGATTAASLLPPGFNLPGAPLLCESEWMAVTPAGVLRGQFGSAAAPHGAGAPIRTAYVERAHDLIYNPLWRHAEYEMFAMCQQAGFARLNQYALSIGSAESGTYYGAYHVQTQRPGRGDGSDGQADNRATLATPGKVGSKPYDVNQDEANVSVRGRAFLDWMRGTKVDRELSELRRLLAR